MTPLGIDIPQERLFFAQALLITFQEPFTSGQFRSPILVHMALRRFSFMGYLANLTSFSVKWAW